MVALKVMLLVFWFNFLNRNPTMKPSMPFMMKVPGANWAATKYIGYGCSCTCDCTHQWSEE